MIHPEVVLERNRGKCLCSSFHRHILLSLDSLVETVAPTSSFHDTASLLIHDLYLAVIGNDIVDVLLEHCISLEKLDHGMDALALECIILHEGILAALLLCRRFFALFNVGHH